MQKTIFSEDMTSNTMLVERDFAGSLEQVWQAWTDSEILAEWWAPLPFKAITKKFGKIIFSVVAFLPFLHPKN